MLVTLKLDCMVMLYILQTSQSILLTEVLCHLLQMHYFLLVQTFVELLVSPIYRKIFVVLIFTSLSVIAMHAIV